MKRIKNYVEGRWKVAEKGDVQSAISYMHKFKGTRRWTSITDGDVDELFSNIIDNIRKREEKLVEILKIEIKKSEDVTQGEIRKTIATFKVLQNHRYECIGEVYPSRDSQALQFTSRMPVGVCVAFLSWNSPIYNAAQNIAPAIFCRNPLILKPSPLTPLSVKTLFKILLDSGVPKDMVCLVNGEGDELQDLITDSRVDMVSFTGSSENAKRIGELRRGRRFIFEGGGVNFIYVSDKSDVQKAVENAVTGCTTLSGQKCVSTNIVLVHRKVYDRFTALTIKEMEEKKVEPLIRRDYAEKIHKEILGAEESGAKILIGAKLKGACISPTLITLPISHDLISREILAPVLRIAKVDSLKQAIDTINRQEFGLSSAIFTNTSDEAHTFITEVETGLVYVNSHTGGSEPHIPFGGMKASGNGFRLGNPNYAINAFSEVKTVKWNM